MAEVTETLVGSALWAAQDGGLYFARLAVAPSWRRRGLAAALVAAAEAAARQRGLPCMRLEHAACAAGQSAAVCRLRLRRDDTRGAPGYAEPTFVNMEKRLSWAPGPG